MESACTIICLIRFTEGSVHQFSSAFINLHLQDIRSGYYDLVRSPILANRKRRMNCKLHRYLRCPSCRLPRPLQALRSNQISPRQGAEVDKSLAFRTNRRSEIPPWGRDLRHVYQRVVGGWAQWMDYAKAVVSFLSWRRRVASRSGLRFWQIIGAHP